MGTRGAVGFRVDGEDKVAYNHFDSYPSELGRAVLADATALLDYNDRDELRAKARAIRLVDETAAPTEEDKRNLAAITRTHSEYGVAIGGGSDDDWYCLFHKAQGRLGVYLAVGLMPDCHEFLVDSLFCEWAYIVNLDTNPPTLEVYKGFQKAPHEKGRYAALPPYQTDFGATYYPVALVAELDVTANDAVEKLLALEVSEED